MNQTPTAKTAFGVVLMSILLAFLLTGIVSIVLGPDTDQKLLVYTSIFIGQGFMAVPLIIYLHKNKIQLVRALRLNPVSPRIIAGTVLIAIGTVFISEEFDRLMEFFIADPMAFDQIEQFLKIDSFNSGIILFLGIAVFAPIGEELLFRGYLLQALENHWQDITRAILVTALAFAIIHLNPYWVIQAYLMGVVLGYLSWRTNSVLPAIICHGVYNALALLLTNLFPADTAFYRWGNHVSPIWLLLAVGAIIAGLYLLNSRREVSA